MPDYTGPASPDRRRLVTADEAADPEDAVISNAQDASTRCGSAVEPAEQRPPRIRSLLAACADDHEPRFSDG